ncbi:MAG: acyltransferase [Nitrosomonas sp.]|nr:acyltransferase [Nitrosomonas sp.]
MRDVSESFYIPSLDGMRAVAAILVFVAHAGWSHIVPGGFGVTIFFFLSGYLITTLLRREYERTGSINFKIFIYAVRIEYFHLYILCYF